MPSIHEFPPKACQDYTDAELIAMMRAAGPPAERALDCLYKLYFGLARQSMKHHRLDQATVLEAYANALMALRDKVLGGKYRADGPLKAFFAMIFKFKCIDELRRRTTNEADDPELRRILEEELATSTPEEQILAEETRQAASRTDERRAACMSRAMAPFQERDRTMLMDYFINELSLTQITEQYKFKNNRVTSTILANSKNKLQKEIETLCKTDPNCQLLCPDSGRQTEPQ